jgi:hypothetical protein
MNAFRYALFAVGLAVCCGADWLQFRGTDNTGSTGAAKVPATEFQVKTAEQAAKNILWSTELPFQGVSPSRRRTHLRHRRHGVTRSLHVACYQCRRNSWQRHLRPAVRSAIRRVPSSRRPGLRRRRIYAFYSSNDLICLDLDGNLQYRGLTLENPAVPTTSQAASPLVVNGAVVAQPESKVILRSIDAATGETLRRIPQADMN